MTYARWEYRLELVHLGGKDGGETARAEVTEMLDTLGADGWEAIGFSPSQAASHGFRVETSEYVVLLKREKRSTKSR